MISPAVRKGFGVRSWTMMALSEDKSFELGLVLL